MLIEVLIPDGIMGVLQVSRSNNMGIEYIETNASWYRDEESAIAVLNELLEHGVHTLLISMDPFHNEYIPFRKVKALIKAYSKAGKQVFPLQNNFWSEIAAKD